MKKFILLASVFALVGCGAGNNGDSIDIANINNTDDLASEKECILGEVYSLDALSFDICSQNIVTVGPVEGNLNMLKLDNQTTGYIVEGDFEDDLVIVDREELVTSLENNLFGGITGSDDEGFGMNYVEFDGAPALEVDFLGSNQGNKYYFALVEDDLLLFDFNFNALSILTAVIPR